jgi:hypothetical protein
MKLPFILRSEHDDTVKEMLLSIDALEQRLRDVERQFAVEYDDAGKVVKTLADVPPTERANVKVLKHPRNPMLGMSWPQRRRWLEVTDGGRKINNG